MPENPVERHPAQDARRGNPDRSRLAGFGIRAAIACSIPLGLGLVFMAADAAFEVRSSLEIALVTMAATAIFVMLLIGLRDLQVAENRAEAALARALDAEAAERSRADQLGRVLEASQGLHVAGRGKVQTMDVLAAITPPGATSFLVRSGPDGPRIEAAHGPLAPTVVTATVGSGHGQTGEPAVDGSILRTFSAHGRTSGPGIPDGHIDGIVAPIESALVIPLLTRDGTRVASLHLIDPDQERVLDPAFMSLAQLVGNQIAVAMENEDLLAHLRRQLAEVQRVQQQLVQASKLGAIGELAAAVAHEVNNPLTGILGFAELLLAGMDPGDQRRAELTIIRDEAMRARTIIRSLLDFARPRTPQRVESDVNALAHDAVDLVRYRAQEAHVQIREDYATLPSVEVDPDALEQVLLNLATNGLEAMPDGGELSVTTYRTGDRLAIVVADTGVGMDHDTRERIFTPFFSARTRGGYGSGLGLSVGLNIVQGHGGTIEVQSEPGRGSTFTVWLPVAPLPRRESSPEAGGVTAPAGAEVPA
jgi:signal transduction histidine kinase